MEALLARGEDKIILLDLNKSDLFAEEERDGRVRFVKGSVNDDSSKLVELFKGVDTVFHTAAIINYWERLPFQWAKFETVNVKGTQVIIPIHSD